MKLYVAILLLGLIVACAANKCAREPPCRPDYCFAVRCAGYTDSQCKDVNATWVKKGGTCGCCDACFIHSRKGEKCDISEVRGVRRVTVTFKCDPGDPGLCCINSTCTYPRRSRHHCPRKCRCHTSRNE